MGAAAGDFDGDGRWDLAISNVGLDVPLETAAKLMRTDEAAAGQLIRNLLLRQLPDGSFDDVGLDAGLKSATDTEKHVDLTAWAVAAFDFDRDGWLDLAMAHAPEADAYAFAKRGPMRPVLWRNRGDGRFDEVSALAGWPAPFAGLGLSLGDVDGDGDDDVALGGLGAAPRLLRNDVQTPHHWLRIVLRGTVSNSLGIGAAVEVEAGGRVLRRMVGAASAFSTQHDPVAHFGLGSASQVAQVTVRWPSGWVQQLGPLAANQVRVIEEAPLLTVGPRVVGPGGQVAVTVRGFDSGGKPKPAQVAISVVPPGVLALAKPLQCAPDGTCSTVFAVAQVPLQPTAAFVSVSLDGQPLRTWPRVTVVP